MNKIRNSLSLLCRSKARIKYKNNLFKPCKWHCAFGQNNRVRSKKIYIYVCVYIYIYIYESCRNYSPLSFRFFSQPFVRFLEKNKNVYNAAKVCPYWEKLCSRSWIHKTEGIVFPNTDRPWLVNNIFIFSKNLTNGCEKNLNDKGL